MARNRKSLSRLRWWKDRNHSWWWPIVVVVAPIVMLTGAAVLVLTQLVDASTSAGRLDMIKVALAVGAGTGAAVTLVLARRRQWATEHDAAERRLTELYIKAVEQLGAEQAAVRHGGLYALERVAQDNPGHRQTVVNVICAYLRDPYAPPPANHGPPRVGVRRPLHASPRRSAISSPTKATFLSTQREFASAELRKLQERQVRLTAQKILARHLRPESDDGEQLDTYWSNIDLDLSGATLIGLDLTDCRINTGRFTDAQFVTTTWFHRTEFAGPVTFSGARFTGDAWFDGAQFYSTVRFYRVQFMTEARFNDAQFFGEARFKDTEFATTAQFEGAQFAAGGAPTITPRG